MEQLWELGLGTARWIGTHFGSYPAKCRGGPDRCTVGPAKCKGGPARCRDGPAKSKCRSGPANVGVAQPSVGVA